MKQIRSGAPPNSKFDPRPRPETLKNPDQSSESVYSSESQSASLSSINPSRRHAPEKSLMSRKSNTAKMPFDDKEYSKSCKKQASTRQHRPRHEHGSKRPHKGSCEHLCEHCQRVSPHIECLRPLSLPQSLDLNKPAEKVLEILHF